MIIIIIVSVSDSDKLNEMKRFTSIQTLNQKLSSIKTGSGIMSGGVGQINLVLQLRKT